MHPMKGTWSWSSDGRKAGPGPHYNLNLLDLSIPLDDQYRAVQDHHRQRL